MEYRRTLYIALLFSLSILLFLLFGPLEAPFFILLTFTMIGWGLESFGVFWEEHGENALILSGGMVINFITAIAYGPAAAFIVAFLSDFFALRGLKKFYPLPKALFNASQISICSMLAGYVHRTLVNAGSYPILSISLSAVVYVGLNVTLMGLLVHLIGKEEYEEFIRMLPTMLLAALIPMIFMGVIGAVLYLQFGMLAVGGIIAGIIFINFTSLLLVKYKKAQIEMLLAMVKALEERDPYTKGHSERVANYAKLLARKLNMSHKKENLLYIAGLLHDIGKIGIPDEVLNKPGNLTNEEFKMIMEHPIKGEEIISQFTHLGPILPYVRHHHESWDGSGYPDGLKGEEIPLEARILAIVDVYDALTTNRAYRKAYSREEALEMMKRMKGKKFDPRLLEIFFELMETGDEFKFMAG